MAQHLYDCHWFVQWAHNLAGLAWKRARDAGTSEDIHGGFAAVYRSTDYIVERLDHFIGEDLPVD